MAHTLVDLAQGLDAIERVLGLAKLRQQAAGPFDPAVLPPPPPAA
jgi:hypothetical protein